MIRPLLELGVDDASAMLTGLVAVDVRQMQRAGPNRPRVRDWIEAGELRYSRRDPREHWQSYDQIRREIEAHGYAYADCEDLASMAAAEYRVDGIDPAATIHVYKTAPRVSHVVVRRGTGQLEDPSVAAGMGWDEPRM